MISAVRDLVDATEHLVTIRERETHQARRSRIVDATKRILGEDGEVQEEGRVNATAC